MCETCEGLGEVFTSGLGDPGNPIECQACEGEGYIEWGERDDPDGIFPSYMILEELDGTEYDALSDAQKASLALLLQCGMVDLNDGKMGRVGLWDMFDAESTTRANLIALLA